jgi:hypothetical protein
MRRIRYFAATGLAVATVFALQVGGSGPVFAGGGNGTATHYTAAPYGENYGPGVGNCDCVAEGYTGPVDLGTWSCSGVRVTNSHFARDNFTCATTATDITATFSGSIPWPCGCSGWTSDYDGHPTDNYEIDISDGTVTGWAIYPNAS